MVIERRNKKVLFCAFGILLGMTLPGCSFQDSTNLHDALVTEDNSNFISDSAILIPRESISSDYFPCSECHNEMEPNPQRRELVEMHDDIVFDHDSENRWCLACHDTQNRDSLRLAGNKLLGFDESYKLCGQCHGPKLRDWKMGIHGKRTGEWNGEKQYYLCVHCHDPHSPKFKLIEPMPAPLRPAQISMDSIK